MTEENRRDAISKEWKHAKAAREEARVLVEAGFFNGALSRLYYSLFHAAVALLLTEGIEPKRHRGLPHLLGTHFPNLIGAADIALVTRAASYRDLADYERTFNATAEIVTEALATVDSLVARIERHLTDNKWIG